MARVNVEQTAFGDPRFARLGRLLVGETLAILDLHRLGLGHMAAIWNVCQERGRKTLTPDEIDDTIGKTNASVFLTESGLGSPVKGGRIRIKGTKGRIEWLTNRRKDGDKGGRPPKPKGSTYIKDRDRPSENPPAPAPAPALKEKNHTSRKSGATRCPDLFVLTDELRTWASTKFPQVDLELATEDFCDFWRGIPGARGMKLDWLATWRNAIRRATTRRELLRNDRSPPTQSRLIAAAPMNDE